MVTVTVNNQTKQISSTNPVQVSGPTVKFGEVAIPNLNAPLLISMTDSLAKYNVIPANSTLVNGTVNSDNPNRIIYRLVYTFPDGSRWEVQLVYDPITQNIIDYKTTRISFPTVQGTKPVFNLTSYEITTINTYTQLAKQLPDNTILTNATVNKDNSLLYIYTFYYTLPNGTKRIITISYNPLT